MKLHCTHQQAATITTIAFNIIIRMANTRMRRAGGGHGSGDCGGGDDGKTMTARETMATTMPTSVMRQRQVQL